MRIHIISHWQFRNIGINLIKTILTVLVIVSLTAFGFRFIRTTQIIPNCSSFLPLAIFEGFLSEGLPTLSLQVINSPKKNSQQALTNAVQVLASPLVNFPGASGINQLITAEENYELPQPLIVESRPPTLPKNNKNKIVTDKNPLIAIYNTHNAECYKPSEGSSKVPGKNGGVSKVAKTLADTLYKDYGIAVVHSTTIHDYPDFTKSYTNSKETLKHILAENPSVIVALDIHRDAGLPKPPVVEINNQKVAQVLIVVGSNARLEHPNWRQNEEFAHKLAKKMEELYPGLCRGVRVLKGRYNQHLLPKALLLEFGSDNNTLEEAKNSARLMAHVLAVVVKDLIKEDPTKQN
ncbi:MAG: stage sporulation protein [Clostridia bacterium]|nr:stage sporulation protein [Clostridia bacterium]